MRRTDQHGALGNLVSMVSVGIDAHLPSQVGGRRVAQVRERVDHLHRDAVWA